MVVILLILCFAMTVATILIADKGLNNDPPSITFAQPSGNVTSPLNKTQEWISQRDAVKIVFASIQINRVLSEGPFKATM